MLEGYWGRDVRNYTAEELEQLTAVIDTELRERTTSSPAFYLIGRYSVTFKREKRNYSLEVYRTGDGAVWWSCGGNKHPIHGINTGNITQRSVDFMLLDSMLHTTSKKGIPIEASPANIITNYLDLVTRILSDARVH